MEFLKKIISFYIDASIHVALAVYSLMRISELYFSLPHDENLNTSILLSTIFAYNYIKYNNYFFRKNRPLPLHIKNIFLFSLCCLAVSLYFFYQLNLDTLFVILCFGGISILYSVPFIFVRSLRNYPKLKIIIIAIVWAGVTVLLPLYNSNIPFNTISIIYFIQRFIFIIVLTIPFDIRDLKQDNISLKTIPQLYGIKTTKKIAFVLLLFVLLLEFYFSPNTYFRMVFLLVFFALNMFIQRTTDKQSKYFCSFWVEAIPVFWFLLCLVVC